MWVDIFILGFLEKMFCRKYSILSKIKNKILIYGFQHSNLRKHSHGTLTRNAISQMYRSGVLITRGPYSFRSAGKEKERAWTIRRPIQTSSTNDNGYQTLRLTNDLPLPQLMVSIEKVHFMGLTPTCLVMRKIYQNTDSFFFTILYWYNTYISSLLVYIILI